MRRRSAAPIWVLLLLSGPACTHADGPGDQAPAQQLLQDCDDSDRCAAGLTCIDGQCTRACTSSADCNPNGGCGSDGSGRRLCTDHCTVSTVARPQAVCLDGAYRACSADPCAAPLVCVGGRGCLQPAGASCAQDADCASHNCGKDRTCKVADGEPCDQQNCDLCVTVANAPGRPFCTKICQEQSDCVNGPCLGVALPGEQPKSGQCRLGCVPECQRCTTISVDEYGTGHLQPRQYCDGDIVWPK